MLFYFFVRLNQRQYDLLKLDKAEIFLWIQDRSFLLFVPVQFCLLL